MCVCCLRVYVCVWCVCVCVCWQYTDACQKPRVTTIRAASLLAGPVKHDRVTVAVQQDRTGVCVCVCVCVCARMCVTVYACMCELECMTFCDCLYNCMHCALNLCVCVCSH